MDHNVYSVIDFNLSALYFHPVYPFQCSPCPLYVNALSVVKSCTSLAITLFSLKLTRWKCSVFCVSSVSRSNKCNIFYSYLRVSLFWAIGKDKPFVSFINHTFVFVCHHKDTDPEEEKTRGLIVGILSVMEDHSSAPARLQNVAVVLEEHIVLQDLPDLPTALALLFGLIYALNIQFPKELRYTFEMFQKIFLELGTDLSARVRSLKNKLLL